MALTAAGAVIALAPGAEVSAASFSDAAAAVLNVRLAVFEGLSERSKRSLVAETESIWRKGRVQLRWLKGGPEPDSGSSLRVLVLPRPVGSQGSHAQWPVGELLRFEGTAAIAVASIDAAQRVVTEGLRFEFLDVPAQYDYRVGVVLGRAVAHEIGHYLLQTDTHASRGLMRATIGAQEFANPRTDAFNLDEAAVAHLAAVKVRSGTASLSSEAPFSYRQ